MQQKSYDLEVKMSEREEARRQRDEQRATDRQVREEQRDKEASARLHKLSSLNRQMSSINDEIRSLEGRAERLLSRLKIVSATDVLENRRLSDLLDATEIEIVEAQKKRVEISNKLQAVEFEL